ncbi:MAG: hypothetical protein KC933_29630 [Myxococcales bacterium]|nr:hypothetical protein [Myxococcales bacterium]MCB9647766.1 hypothetical protein [Deltaproteobacteria bacterium]
MSRDHKNILGRLDRRQMLKAAGLMAAGGGAGLPSLLASRRGYAQTEEKPRFLIVLAAAGGASIIDSFLAIRQSEAGAAAAGLNCFVDSEVKSIADSPFRAVDLRRRQVGAIPIPFSSNQSDFVTKHKNDLMVVTQTGTSVNHTIAQKRSLTGNEAWHGRTVQEAVAAQYGAGYPIPNVNMSANGYISPGIDPTTPAFAMAEPVGSAALWPLSLDGAKGIKNLPSRERIALARRMRNEKLDPESNFKKTFADSRRLALWDEQRNRTGGLEMMDLITNLNLYPDIPQIPLGEYGLSESPDGQRVREAFPDFASDPFEAQAALAFLLIKYRVSVTVTIAPSFNVLLDLQRLRVDNPPLAFDFSHQSHRDAQGVMWDRMLRVADKLVDLLKAEEFEAGESFWDRSMIYFATEFGRSKRRPNNAESFGTAHDINNGFAMLSPMVNGNKVLGGVDPTTGMTYGFDPEAPQGVPITGRNMTEKEIYSGIVHALGIDTSGGNLPDMRAMRKNA